MQFHLEWEHSITLPRDQLLWQCQGDLAPLPWTLITQTGADQCQGVLRAWYIPGLAAVIPLSIMEPQARFRAHITISGFLKDHTHSRHSSGCWDGTVQLPGHSLEAPEQPWNSSAPTAVKESQAGAKNQAKAGKDLGRRFLQPCALSGCFSHEKEIQQSLRGIAHTETQCWGHKMSWLEMKGSLNRDESQKICRVKEDQDNKKIY